MSSPHQVTALLTAARAMGERERAKGARMNDYITADECNVCGEVYATDGTLGCPNCAVDEAEAKAWEEEERKAYEAQDVELDAQMRQYSGPPLTEEEQARFEQESLRWVR